ncbi:defensin-like [Anthonomus grandis grandis]|uniref:defensin-like n=1 Tax=Anthonomus grandis grandis TaxID=2921223 RepID=UPI0021654DB6|nr:defensin-like [Anthonomus grandis grandis]
MFKSVAFAFVIVAFLAVSSYSAPPVEDNVYPDTESHLRVRRATCDLGSLSIFGVQLNHAACAAHCIGHGNRGGYCNGQAVCTCRN